MRSRFVVAAALCFAALFTCAQAAPAAQGKNPLSLAYNIKPWTGDLDGMKKRQQVRVLVPYNKTLYFLDKGGTQRGLIVDMMTEFEKRLNAGVKAHYARIHVVFLPTPRDRLIPDLLAGKGDLVAANLTITDERRAQVDFSHPLASGVRELIVTSASARRSRRWTTWPAGKCSSTRPAATTPASRRSAPRCRRAASVPS